MTSHHLLPQCQLSACLRFPNVTHDTMEGLVRYPKMDLLFMLLVNATLVSLTKVVSVT